MKLNLIMNILLIILLIDLYIQRCEQGIVKENRHYIFILFCLQLFNHNNTYVFLINVPLS